MRNYLDCVTSAICATDKVADQTYEDSMEAIDKYAR